MQKIILTYVGDSIDMITEEFVGDQYSVATFGNGDAMLAILESVDEKHDRPVLMIGYRDVQSVRFIYEG